MHGVSSTASSPLAPAIDALREPRVVDVMRDARLWAAEYRRRFPHGDAAEAEDSHNDEPEDFEESESDIELPEILRRFRNRYHAYSELKLLLIAAVDADDAPILRGSLHDLLRHLADELEM